jgi:hypothetical protein
MIQKGGREVAMHFALDWNMLKKCAAIALAAIATTQE